MISDPEDQEPVLTFIRLTSGEDIIAELVGVNSQLGLCTITNPMKVLYIPGKHPGSVILTLIHWIFPKVSESKDFTIQDSHIIATAKPSHVLSQYYYRILIENEEDQYVISPEATNDSKKPFGQASPSGLVEAVEEENYTSDDEYLDELMSEVKTKKWLH